MSASGQPQTDEPHVRCIVGSHAGQAWRLRAGRPLCLALSRKDHKGGSLDFHHEAGAWIFVNQSGMQATVNDIVCRRAVLTDGDRIVVGVTSLLVCIPLSGGAGTELSTDVERGHDELRSSHRSSRRISASCEAVVDDRAAANRISRGRLLSRVGRALKRRDERHDRLDALRDERRGLLQAFGRLALEESGGFGLSAAFLARICAGETVRAAIDDLDQAALDRFRQAHERLRGLDVEVASLCVELGLDHDVDGTVSQETLPSEHREQVDQAFVASDGLSTDALDGLCDVSPDDDNGAQASVSGRRRRAAHRRKTGH